MKTDKIEPRLNAAGFFRSVGIGYSYPDDDKPMSKSENNQKQRAKPRKEQIMALRDLERVLGIKSEVSHKTKQTNDGGWKSYTILRQKTATGYVFYGTGRFNGLRVESEEPVPPVTGGVFKNTDIFKAVRIKDITSYNDSRYKGEGK